ncbi:MAG TPA: TrbG/VirB9 family P-type conjugative transfer protein [Steroidobacteraceae bacterium]|nr:TrbG/VirB9 family P-type conjugative transfer protein [Steroidobacteraceae bacterium]
MIAERTLTAARRHASRSPALILGTLALIASAQHLRAEIHPARGRGDARVRTAQYDADEVYRIHGFVGYQIDLEFAPGEAFVGLAAGDIDGLSFVAESNHLFLKPRALAVTTNLTVLTTRREYQLDYSVSTAPVGEADPDLIYVLRFEYPRPAGVPADAARRAVDLALRTAPAEHPHNLDYWYCGSPSLRPLAAWDDGVHTHVSFRSNAELPALFVANDDGSESLLNFDVEDGEIVIHRIARRFILRRGALTGCIVNKGYGGPGERLESGTVSREVHRLRKGVEP